VCFVLKGDFPIIPVAVGIVVVIIIIIVIILVVVLLKRRRRRQRSARFYQPYARALSLKFTTTVCPTLQYRVKMCGNIPIPFHSHQLILIFNPIPVMPQI